VWAVTATPTIGSSMETYSKLLPALLLLILVVPQVVADEPPENGPYVEYYENGKKRSEAHYKNGKRDGLATQWHKNGQKELESHYKDGKKEGLETWWYENGEKAQESHFDDGIIVSASTWKPDGQPCPETKVVDGSGIVVMYRENGQKRW